MSARRFHIGAFLLAAGLAALPAQKVWAARDAAFMAPSTSTVAGQEEIKIEPKSDVDLGDTGVNTARRTTFFFANVAALPIGIVEVTANGDSNVRASVVDDDCTKQGSIAVGSRCSVSIETTPSGAGSWTAELLVTYKGAGRIARARVTGRTTGGSGANGREAGLSLSSKDIKPVDFGDIEVGTDRAVRTALMVNDSGEPITLLSVDVIAAENGLEKLEQGCAAELVLKPGESCPVTMLWRPEAKGLVSTDLILRHSGRQGFSVIPVRGVAKEASLGKEGGGARSASGASSGSSKIPLSPTADELEKMLTGQVTPLPESAVAPPAGGAGGKGGGSSLGVHLIGTVGNRGVFYLDEDGSSVVVALGEAIEANGKSIRLTDIRAKQAEIYVEGKKKTLQLELVGALAARAAGSVSSASPATSGSAGKSGASSAASKAGQANSSTSLPVGR